jgi:hypothetical protein
METKQKGGAQLGRKTNTNRRKEATKREEIRIYSPSDELKEYLDEEIVRLNQSKSLVALGLINEGMNSRKKQ